MKTITVATRAGALAVAQTNIIISELLKLYPDIKVDIKKVKTRGDIDRRTALWDIKESGFFTSLVEDTLLAGQADFAVHSFKDLPTTQRDGLAIAAVCNREFTQDCLVSAKPANSIDQLASAAKIGTSSLRRIVQLKRLRSDLAPAPVRGNVQTRLKKLDTGEFDALVLARAGLERLKLTEKISFIFNPNEFIPAPAQGALAIQMRAYDKNTLELLAPLDDSNMRIVTFAERQILAELQCGCHAPVGAYAEINGNNIIITAFLSDISGENFIRKTTTGPVEKAESQAKKLAEEILNTGGKEILQDLQCT
jgi:hydroxymethylbilane synthase